MAWLLITFVLLLVSTRWITKHIQGIGYLVTRDGQIAMTIYLLLTLPGVLLHEVSHALVAWLLRVRVRRFSIGVRRKRGNQVTLGSVEISRTDPLRASLIGLAPLMSGCIVILLISSRALGVDRVHSFSPETFWRELPGMYGAADFWLWAYFVFAIGNAMFPSAADRHAWWMALLFIAFVGAVLYLAGLSDELVQTFGGWTQRAINYLSYAFAVTLVIDIVFGVILFLIEQCLGLLGFGRVRY